MFAESSGKRLDTCMILCAFEGLKIIKTGRCCMNAQGERLG